MQSRGQRHWQRRRWILGAWVGLLATPLVGCGRRALKLQPLPAGATVLALGDSLTFGTGATPDTAYPAVLASLTGWNVVNAGVPGDTAAQAVARLPALLQEHRPALLLLCVGGNDLLRRMPEADTRAEIRRAVDLARAAGAQVLLIAVPRPTLSAAFTGSLADHKLYGDIAEDLRLPLHRQGWSEVLADDKLKADAIHANAAGYAQFARGLKATAQAVGLLPK